MRRKKEERRTMEFKVQGSKLTGQSRAFNLEPGTWNPETGKPESGERGPGTYSKPSLSIIARSRTLIVSDLPSSLIPSSIIT